MKRNDYFAVAINGIIFLIAGGFLAGLAVAHGMWPLFALALAFIAVGLICVMAVAESARENHR